MNVNTVKRGSVIRYNDKHHIPKNGVVTDETIICPNHWVFNYATGCKFDCQYCYLHSKPQLRPHGGIKPHLKNERITAMDLKFMLKDLEKQTMFHSGELSDSLVQENSLIRDIVPIFNGQRVNEVTNPNGHKLLIVTKDKTNKLIEGSHSQRRVVMSYSLTAKQIGLDYEINVPHVWERIRAAKRALALGYEVRLRIDPIMPINRWDLGFKELIERIMVEIPGISRVTLGCIVATKEIVSSCNKQNNDLSWKDYCTEEGLVPKEKRKELYDYIITLLEDNGYERDIGLCKEPVEVWESIGLDWTEPKCNCIL